MLADRVGFEPTVRLHVRLISSQVHSTSLPPVLGATVFGLKTRLKCYVACGSVCVQPGRTEAEHSDKPAILARFHKIT